MGELGFIGAVAGREDVMCIAGFTSTEAASAKDDGDAIGDISRAARVFNGGWLREDISMALGSWPTSSEESSTSEASSSSGALGSMRKSSNWKADSETTVRAREVYQSNRLDVSYQQIHIKSTL